MLSSFDFTALSRQFAYVPSPLECTARIMRLRSSACFLYFMEQDRQARVARCQSGPTTYAFRTQRFKPLYFNILSITAINGHSSLAYMEQPMATTALTFTNHEQQGRVQLQRTGTRNFTPMTIIGPSPGKALVDWYRR